MENTDKIKDMITLIEKNNENYHYALSNLADTFNKSLSSVQLIVPTQELTGKELENSCKKRRTGKNPITTLSKLLSRKF